MLTFVKKPIVIFIILFLVLGAGVYKIFSKHKVNYEEIKVIRRDIKKEISVSGIVKPKHKVMLSFETTGKVARIYKQLGDSVKAGEIIIELSSESALNNIAKQEARLASSQAELGQFEALLSKDKALLSELHIGVRAEEVEIQRVKVNNAQIALADANDAVGDQLRDIFTKGDDAIRGKADQLFINPRSSSPQLSALVSSNSIMRAELEWERLTIESALNSWGDLINNNKKGSDYSELVSFTDKNEILIRNFLNKLFLVLSGLTPNTNLTQSTIDLWRADISVARANFNIAINNLSNAKNNLRAKESLLALEQGELKLKLSPTIIEKIQAQEAEILQDEANINTQLAKINESRENLNTSKIELAKTKLRSPINGVIAVMDGKVGEVVSASIPVAVIISENDYEIEAQVPEASIVSIAIGDIGFAIFDAYYDRHKGNELFDIFVAEIDPVETFVEGISAYKMRLYFKSPSPGIKSGLTGTVIITTDTRENVLAIPEYLIKRNNNINFIQKLDGENIVEVPIELGLRGSRGFVEVISGIQEGEKILHQF